jgi:hypothetical protein
MGIQPETTRRKSKNLPRFKQQRKVLYFSFDPKFKNTIMAGGEGLEPSPTGPEPGVLPLDDPPKRSTNYISRSVIRQAKSNA